MVNKTTLGIFYGKEKNYRKHSCKIHVKLQNVLISTAILNKNEK